jgi:hypothetical protein
LSYANAIESVQVNLSNSVFVVPASPNGSPDPFAGAVLQPDTASGGFPGTTVSLSGANITNVVGTPEADIFVTGPGYDTINGNSGSDLFVVASSGTLTAGSGTDSRFLFAGAGSSIINGGGASTLDFSQAPNPVDANLQAGSASGGFGGTQTVNGMLDLVGTDITGGTPDQSGDQLVGGPQHGTIIGLGIDRNFLEAGPNGEDTLISYGSGNDTFCASSSCQVGGTTARGPDTMTGGTGDDIFFARNGQVDTIDGGPPGCAAQNSCGFNSAQIDSIDHDTNINATLP